MKEIGDKWEKKTKQWFITNVCDSAEWKIYCGMAINIKNKRLETHLCALKGECHYFL